MRKPQRGEIWRVKLSDPNTGRKALGTEIGAKRDKKTRIPKPDRPCLIVSANIYNDTRDSLTIAPLTDYYPAGKEDTMSQWAVTVRPGDEIIVDPANEEYPDDEQLWKKSIIDCAQLLTVFAVEPSRRQANPLLPNDLFWNRRYGQLTDMSMRQVDSVLERYVICGGAPNRPSDLLFREGRVLLLDLPKTQHTEGSKISKRRDPQQCLVISSEAIDYPREKRIIVERLNRPLGHITVVPLVLETDSQYKKFHDVATEVIIDIEGQSELEIALAIHQQIHTVDWRSRIALDRPIGRVSDMADVRSALLEYLGLSL